MLNNRNFRIVLSLLAAVLLWAYVVGYVDTSTTKQIRGVPITFTHVSELGERGLAVSGLNIEGIDVEVRGSRSALSDIGTSDITATVDLASASKGDNDLTIVLKVPPGGISITNRSATRVTVTVEDQVQKQVPVEIVYEGTFDEGQSGNTVKLSSETISISGAESVVNKVARLKGTIDASRVTSTPTEITCQLEAVNVEGNLVEEVFLGQDTVIVTTVLSSTKDVKLIVPVEDSSSDGNVRTVEVPEIIKVVGRADALAKITEIEAKPVDITNIPEDTEIPLEIELPEGISLVDNDTPFMLKLTISPVTTKTINYSSSDIQMTGQKSNYEYNMPSSSFAVVVLDSATKLSNISKDNISLSCDVSSLGVGVTSCPIILNAGDLVLHGLTIAPETVDITVTLKTQN